MGLSIKREGALGLFVLLACAPQLTKEQRACLRNGEMTPKRCRMSEEERERDLEELRESTKKLLDEIRVMERDTDLDALADEIRNRGVIYEPEPYYPESVAMVERALEIHEGAPLTYDEKVEACMARVLYTEADLDERGGGIYEQYYDRYEWMNDSFCEDLIIFDTVLGGWESRALDREDPETLLYRRIIDLGVPDVSPSSELLACDECMAQSGAEGVARMLGSLTIERCHQAIADHERWLREQEAEEAQRKAEQDRMDIDRIRAERRTERERAEAPVSSMSDQALSVFANSVLMCSHATGTVHRAELIGVSGDSAKIRIVFIRPEDHGQEQTMVVRLTVRATGRPTVTVVSDTAGHLISVLGMAGCGLLVDGVIDLIKDHGDE